jgi:3-polyprenyl-4-hydroxybenzoate decarboxylase
MQGCDVYASPITNGVNIRVQVKKHYQGQPKQIAAALWGNSAALYRYKHEEDIDPADDEQVEWALAHRVTAGEGGVIVFPGIFGSPIDPSTPMEDRDAAQLGTGLWNRMLIDATRSWKSPRRPEWSNQSAAGQTGGWRQLYDHVSVDRPPAGLQHALFLKSPLEATTPPKARTAFGRAIFFGCARA